MTPLAHQLAKQLILPAKERSAPWDGACLSALMYALDDCRFFEVTAVLPLARDLMHATGKSGMEAGPEFLWKYAVPPAPKIWIEIHSEEGRCGYFFEKGLGDHAEGYEIMAFRLDGFCYLGCLLPEINTIEVYGGDKGLPPGMSEGLLDDLKRGLLSTNDSDSFKIAYFLAHCLALINSPKIVGARTHKPHKPLVKRLVQAFKTTGFKVHPWSEIKLEINKPADIDDGEPHTSHITGGRALHFCRRHLRLTHGKLVWVKSHWRADPSPALSSHTTR